MDFGGRTDDHVVGCDRHRAAGGAIKCTSKVILLYEIHPRWLLTVIQQTTYLEPGKVPHGETKYLRPSSQSLIAVEVNQRHNLELFWHLTV